MARIGRPPDTDPAETRRRILDSARHAFAAEGFAAATNRSMAAGAGVTTGALYHHYGSKASLYAAVHADAHDQVYDRLTAAVASHESFLAKFDAVLDEALAINRQDASLARFIAGARVDRRRHTELSEALPDDRLRRSRFYRRLVDDGVAAGQIDAERRKELLTVIETLIAGLNESAAAGTRRQGAVIDAIRATMHRLVSTPG